MAEKADIGIVIALKEEFKELFAGINPTFDFETTTNTYYYLFQTQIANAPHTCVATFINSDDMGTTKAALATERLLSKFSPNKIINIGIAGSLDTDLSLGDVVVARQTDNYLHNAKSVDSSPLNNKGSKSKKDTKQKNTSQNGFEFKLSGDPYKTTEKYIHHANNLEMAHQPKYALWTSSCKQKLSQLSASQESISSELQSLTQNNLLKNIPSIRTGNIASSTLLGASINFVNWLKTHDRKYIAIEMESVGVADATHTHGKEILIIRGISDFSDDRKKQIDNIAGGIFRKYAMHNIISLMWLLLDVDASLQNHHAVNTKTQTKTYYLLLDGTFDDFTKPKVEAALEVLKRHTKDLILDIRETYSGSVVLVLEGSEDGYNNLKLLLAQNPNLEILGHKILQVSLHPFPKSPSSNTNKTVHNLPERNHFFTGREDVLNKLSNSFNSHKGAAIKQAISGLAGMGKTHTAIEFCHRHINNYQTILWITAENTTSFNRSYNTILDLLNLNPNNQVLKIDQVISLVKRWLTNNPNWLMVLDNLESPNLINLYLPPNHKGHILITTCSSPVDYASVIPLKKMPLELATLFLLKRAYPDSIDCTAQSLEQISIDNQFLADAQNLAKPIDGLPLALKQAASFIYQTKCSLPDYLSFYQQALLDSTVEDLGDHPSVFITFNLAFDKIKEKNLTAAKLLQACSFLDPDFIPIEIFTNAGNFLGQELSTLKDNNYEFYNSVKLLRNYSLIEHDPNNNSLSIHRLVQAVLRLLMDTDTTQAWIKNLIKALTHLSPNDPENPQYWPLFQSLLPSSLVLSQLFNTFNLTIPEAITLFHHSAIYCSHNALIGNSEQLYEEALRITRIVEGEEHVTTLGIMNNLAWLYISFGLKHKYPKAELLLTKLISLQETQTQTPNSTLNLAGAKGNLALLYSSQNKFNEAERLFNEALALEQPILEITNERIIGTKLNLADLYRKWKKFPEAKPLYEEIEKLNDGLRLSDDLQARRLNNLGLYYEEQNKLDKAEEFYRKALEVKKKLYGENHPLVATTLFNLGYINFTQGNFQDAEDYLKPAFYIRLKSLSLFHADTKEAFFLLKNTYRIQQKDKEIESLNKHIPPELQAELTVDKPLSITFTINLTPKQAE